MIRQPAVSGMFYPLQKTQLRETVNSLINEVPIDDTGSPIGLVVPHAGYDYSGKTAATAYARLAGGEYNTAIIVSPSHREFFDGVSIYPGDGYRTPLGDIPINHELREMILAQSEIIMPSTNGHHDEHAIEVQLPFIQSILPDASILPIVLGNQEKQTVKILSEALKKTLDTGNNVIIASSDLSHFHSLDEARKLDATARSDIERLDPDSLMQHLENGTTEACGGGPIAAMLYATIAHGGTHCEILHQTTSAETTRDSSRVVGYLAAAIYKNRS